MVFVLSDKNECAKSQIEMNVFSKHMLVLLKAFLHTSVSVVWLPPQIAVHVVSASMTDRTPPLLFPNPYFYFFVFYLIGKRPGSHAFLSSFTNFQMGFT